MNAIYLTLGIVLAISPAIYYKIVSYKESKNMEKLEAIKKEKKLSKKAEEDKKNDELEKKKKMKQTQKLLAKVIRASTFLIVYLLLLVDSGVFYPKLIHWISFNFITSGIVLVIGMLVTGYGIRKLFTFIYDKRLKVELIGTGVNNNPNNNKEHGYEKERDRFLEIIVTSFLSALMTAIILVLAVSILSCLFSTNKIVNNLKSKCEDLTNFKNMWKWVALLLSKYIWFDGLSVDYKKIKETLCDAAKNMITYENIGYTILFVLGLICGAYPSSKFSDFMNDFTIGMLVGAILLLTFAVIIILIERKKQEIRRMKTSQ